MCMKSLTEIDFQRISTYQLGPRVCPQQTAVVFIIISSRYKNKTNGVENTTVILVSPEGAYMIQRQLRLMTTRIFLFYIFERSK